MSGPQPIKAIYGHEPMREGETPEAYIVGHNSVARIEHEMHNYGDHGIGWYNVFREDGAMVASMQERAVASVIWGGADA